MTETSTRVRPANIADAAVLGDIHVAAWRAAYRGIMPPDYLAALAVEDRAALWTTVISRANPAEIVLVAERAGSLIGFCAAGSAWRPDEAALGEVQSLNVHPSAWGTGVGDALIAGAEDWLRERRFHEAVLWVVRDNPRARGFYERHGWTDDGRSDVATILGVTVPEVRYRRHLAG